jgi:transposase
MPARFVTVDRDTPLLLPPDLRDWLPEDHLAHFILEAVNALPLTGARVNERGTGSQQYPPRMLLAVLVYCYATGLFSSRQIERATYTDVAVRFLAGDTHPDHDTLCAFRRGNAPLLKNSFVEVLKLAREMKVLKVGRIAVDGTKIQANASKHAAVSYQRAGEKIEELESEVTELLGKAEQADATPLEDGLTLPGEVARRRDRIEKLKAARATMEERAKQRAEAERADYEAKKAAREAKRQRGERVGGREPQPPSQQPQDADQYNFTDPQSRIMKAGNGAHFEQAYNAQAAVDTDSRLIVAARVTTAANDKEQLVPTVAAIPQEVATDVTEVLADSGFASQKAIEQMERDGRITVYVAVEKTSHHRRVCDLERRDDPPPPPPEAGAMERMRHRLRTKAGRAIYRLRQQTVEPIFGIVKEAMGFRRFLLRGEEQVDLEWTLVSLAYNLRRLHRLAPVTL